MRQYQRPAGRYHIAAVLAVLLGLSSFGFLEAEAQQAASFEQLLLLVTAGDVFGAFFSDCRGSCAGDRAAMIGVMSALGAGIGVGVDALIIRTQVIYRGPSSAR